MLRPPVLAIAAAVSLAFPARADQIMVMKAGEWVRSMNMADGPGGAARGPGSGPALKVCNPADRTLTDEGLSSMLSGIGNGQCTSNSAKAANIVTINASCAVKDTIIKTRITMTLVNDDEYDVESISHVDNPPRGMSPDMSMAIHWVRTGPCQPGDRPMPPQKP